MPKRKSTFKITGPKIKVTKKELRVTKPRARVGNKVRLNFSSNGVSGSIKTPLGTYNNQTWFGQKENWVPARNSALIIYLTNNWAPDPGPIVGTEARGPLCCKHITTPSDHHFREN